MGFVNDNNQADIKLSEELLSAKITDAVIGTKGVHSLYGGLSLSFLNKGLKLNITDEGVIANIYVIVNYGMKIPEVAWNIQESVKHEIESAGSTALEINIHVQGVYFNEEAT